MLKQVNHKAQNYDTESAAAGWDSPDRARRLAEPFVTNGSVVLDIGVGTGLAVRGYVEKGATVIGLDSDQSMLDAAQIVTGSLGSMRLVDINKGLPIDELCGQIDVAQAIGVLEFAENIEDVLRQVSSTLKPGGIFVFTVETRGDTSSTEATTDYPDAGIIVHRHSREEITALLQTSGYRLLSEEAYDGYHRGDTADGKVPYHIFLAQKSSL